MFWLPNRLITHLLWWSKLLNRQSLIRSQLPFKASSQLYHPILVVYSYAFLSRARRRSFQHINVCVQSDNVLCVRAWCLILTVLEKWIMYELGCVAVAESQSGGASVFHGGEVSGDVDHQRKAQEPGPYSTFFCPRMGMQMLGLMSEHS